jgi:hypothetical protein
MLGDGMARTARARDAARAAGIWLGMALASGLALGSARWDAVALVATLGTLVAMSHRPWAVAAPLGAAAFLDLAILPWAVAAIAISRGTSPGFAPPRLDSEPQRQLMRSRRRNEAASVVVVQANRPPEAAQLWSLLRVTDGFDLVTGRNGIELRAVLEDQGLNRTAFEQRIRGVLGESQVRIGWASLPADGVTLEVLVDAARAHVESPDAGLVTEPASASPAVPAPVAPSPAVPSPAAAIAEGA